MANAVFQYKGHSTRTRYFSGISGAAMEVESPRDENPTYVYSLYGGGGRGVAAAGFVGSGSTTYHAGGQGSGSNLTRRVRLYFQLVSGSVDGSDTVKINLNVGTDIITSPPLPWDSPTQYTCVYDGGSSMWVADILFPTSTTTHTAHGIGSSSNSYTGFGGYPVTATINTFNSSGAPTGAGHSFTRTILGGGSYSTEYNISATSGYSFNGFIPSTPAHTVLITAKTKLRSSLTAAAPHTDPDNFTTVIPTPRACFAIPVEQKDLSGAAILNLVPALDKPFFADTQGRININVPANVSSYGGTGSGSALHRGYMIQCGKIMSTTALLADTASVGYHYYYRRTGVPTPVSLSEAPKIHTSYININTVPLGTTGLETSDTTLGTSVVTVSAGSYWGNNFKSSSEMRPWAGWAVVKDTAGNVVSHVGPGYWNQLSPVATGIIPYAYKGINLTAPGEYVYSPDSSADLLPGVDNYVVDYYCGPAGTPLHAGPPVMSHSIKIKYKGTISVAADSNPSGVIIGGQADFRLHKGPDDSFTGAPAFHNVPPAPLWYQDYMVVTIDGVAYDQRVVPSQFSLDTATNMWSFTPAAPLPATNMDITMEVFRQSTSARPPMVIHNASTGAISNKAYPTTPQRRLLLKTSYKNAGSGGNAGELNADRGEMLAPMVIDRLTRRVRSIDWRKDIAGYYTEELHKPEDKLPYTGRKVTCWPAVRDLDGNIVPLRRKSVLRTTLLYPGYEHNGGAAISPFRSMSYRVANRSIQPLRYTYNPVIDDWGHHKFDINAVASGLNTDGGGSMGIDGWRVRKFANVSGNYSPGNTTTTSTLFNRWGFTKILQIMVSISSDIPIGDIGLSSDLSGTGILGIGAEKLDITVVNNSSYSFLGKTLRLYYVMETKGMPVPLVMAIRWES